MKKTIFLLFITAWLITPYSCKKGVDPVKPPTDTIPAVDSAYIRFLDTMGRIYQMTSDSNYFLKNKPLDTIRKYLDGKWQSRFIYGGNLVKRYYFENSFTEFIIKDNYQDSINFYSNISTDFLKKELYWSWKFTVQGDSTFAYLYKTDAIDIFNIVHTLKNDTLITFDDTNHGYLRLLTRVR